MINKAQQTTPFGAYMITFKQFATYLSDAEGKSEDQLDELWSQIFGKKKKEEEDDEDDKKSGGKFLTAKDLERKRKELADRRKSELNKKRDDEWQKAKDRLENARSNNGPRSSRHDDTIWHAGMANKLRESKKTAYSDEGYWKDEAKEKGYKIRKLSGDMMKGDQTWGAFDGDKKVGEFTEKEEGRGGWLM